MLESLNRISQNEEENEETISNDLLKSDHKMF